MIKVLILVTAFIAVTSGDKKKTIEPAIQLPNTETIRRYEVIPIYAYVLQSGNYKSQLLDKIGQLIIGEDSDSESSDESGSSTSSDESDTSSSSSDESGSSSQSSESDSSESSSDSDSSSSSDSVDSDEILPPSVPTVVIT